MRHSPRVPVFSICTYEQKASIKTVFRYTRTQKTAKAPFDNRGSTDYGPLSSASLFFETTKLNFCGLSPTW